MSFKENLQSKIKLNRLFLKRVSTMREPPGKWWLDKVLTQELLDMTKLEHEKVRDLHLYIRPMEGENMGWYSLTSWPSTTLMWLT